MSKRDKDSDASFPKLSTVKYDAITDRQVGDRRFEREKAYKENTLSLTTQSSSAPSTTFDAFQRLAAGVEQQRSIADILNDPNRPTWEQYKKENEDKLSLVGTDVKKMVEYRAQLDKERSDRLKVRKRDVTVSDSDEDSREQKKKKKHKKNKKKSKKRKDHKDKDKERKGKDSKEKKKKKKKSVDSGSDSESSSSSSSSL